MITKVCEQCGKSYNVIPSRKQRRFCSKPCRLAYHRNPPVTIICEVCGKPFTAKACRHDARFCSLSCGGKWHMQNKEMPHTHMPGNQLRKGLVPTNAFKVGQTRGRNNARWVEPIVLACSNCEKPFERKPWQIRQDKSKYGLQFCSQTCHYAYMRGTQSPHWVGGPQTYRGRGWLKAREAAIARDNGTCQKCGKVVGSSIPVHHIRPFREFTTAEEANGLGNLVCLCRNCHSK